VEGIDTSLPEELQVHVHSFGDFLCSRGKVKTFDEHVTIELLLGRILVLMKELLGQNAIVEVIPNIGARLQPINPQRHQFAVSADYGN
jgi:hypothetical protein